MTTRQGEKMAGYIQLLQDTLAITTDSMWHDSRHLIDKDPRYQAVESDLLREQWFRQYVKQLKKAFFIQLLQNTHEITQCSNFHGSRKCIITDLRYNVFDTDLHRLQLFSQYVEQLADNGNEDTDIWRIFCGFISIDGRQKFPIKPVSMVFKPSYVEQPNTSSNLDEISRLSQVEQVEHPKVFKPSYVEQPNTLSNPDEISRLSQVEQVEHPKVDQITHIQKHTEIKEFANWIKCVLAQTKTREVLVIVVSKSFDMFIKRTNVGKKILIFLECLETQNILHIKVKRKDKMTSINHRNKKKNADNKSTWNCEHSSCAYLFKTLLEHYIPKQTDEWDIFPSTENKQDQYENKGSTPKNIASTLSDEEVKQSDGSSLSEDQLWLIAKLYTFTESKNEDQTLHELDISQIIKLQRCCNLFEFEGSAEIYDKIIENRNNLMHSKNNIVSSEDLKKIFETFYSLLEAFGKEFDVCAGVIKELKEFEKSLLEITVHDMVRTFEEEAIQALDTKKKALQNDIYYPDDISNPDIESLLKETQEKNLNLVNKMKEMEQDIIRQMESYLTAKISNESNRELETQLNRKDEEFQALKQKNDDLIAIIIMQKDERRMLEESSDDLNVTITMQNEEIRVIQELNDDLNATITMQNEEIRVIQELSDDLNATITMQNEEIRVIQELRREMETMLGLTDEDIPTFKQWREKMVLQLITEREELPRRLYDHQQYMYAKNDDLNAIITMQKEEIRMLQESKREMETMSGLTDEEIPTFKQWREKKILQLNTEKEVLKRRLDEFQQTKYEQMHQIEETLRKRRGDLTSEQEAKLRTRADLIQVTSKGEIKLLERELTYIDREVALLE